MPLNDTAHLARASLGEHQCGHGNTRSQWLFIAFLVAVNLPNFYWLDYFGALNVNLIEYGERLLLSLLLGACFLALFARPWVAWLSIWLLYLWWQPLAWAVRLISGTPITPTLVGTAISTNPAELRNLATAIPWVWFAFFAIWNVGCFLLFRLLKRRKNARWRTSFRGKILFFSIAMLALPHLILRERAPETEKPFGNVEAAKPAVHGRYNAGHPLLAFEQADRQGGGVARLPEAYPYELPWAIAQYFRGRRVIDAIRANLHEPPRLASLMGSEPQLDVLVLVIGESSTRNAWHLFNAAAPLTTPKLEGRIARGEALFGFTRVLAQTSATRQAVPSILTNQPLVWPDGSPNPSATRSIVSVAAQAGFATAWFSNQAAVGQHDGIIATYAEEAASVAFLNPASFADRGSLDEVLLPAVQRHLQEHPKAFIVLHTMGSHFNYSYRYPAGFGPFPSPSNAQHDYYNSVAYTDHVLDQVIGALETTGRSAALVYVSDHGEGIPFGTCNVEPAKRTTRDAYEVPALVWLSPSYGIAHPEILQQLRTHQAHPYTVSAVPQTLLDLARADATMPLAEDRVESFLRTTSPLEVNGHASALEWVGKFDRAAQKNPCFMILR